VTEGEPETAAEGDCVDDALGERDAEGVSVRAPVADGEPERVAGDEGEALAVAVPVGDSLGEALAVAPPTPPAVALTDADGE
jgi:hypothetical protein